jgi:hypothetical protein
MQFVLERVTDPEFEPVTLAEMRLHLRTYGDDTDEDNLLEGLITSAREWVEDYTARALVDQTWRLTINQQTFVSGDTVGGFTTAPGYYAGRFDWFQRVGQIMLRKAPVLAITSFVTLDQDGAETTIDASTYQLREAASKWPRLSAKSGANWGTGDFQITFRAGFADTTSSPQQGAEVVPDRYKQAIKLWVEAHYDRDPANMPLLLKTAETLIKPERAELSLA